MAFTFTAATSCFVLPLDLVEAQAALLKVLKTPGEIWLIGYAFTYQPLIDALVAAVKAGNKVHVYLDYSMYTGLVESPDVTNLIANGVEITLGTSTTGPRYICHTKALVVGSKNPWCWTGSLNFTVLGWKQANIVHMFKSKVWANNFITEFKRLRDYAWNKEKDIQVLPNPPIGVTITPMVTHSHAPVDYTPLPEI